MSGWEMWMGAKYGMSKDATRFAGAVGRGALCEEERRQNLEGTRLQWR